MNDGSVLGRFFFFFFSLRGGEFVRKRCLGAVMLTMAGPGGFFLFGWEGFIPRLVKDAKYIRVITMRLPSSNYPV